MSKWICVTIAMAVLWSSCPLPSRADTINLAGDLADATSKTDPGNFTGTLTYTDINSTSATLTISLKNTTTPSSLGGYLTAFVFNNPHNDITGVTSFSDTKGTFQLLGQSTSYDNGINAMPFQYFDLGASLDNKFEGTGNPHNGIAVGASDTFTFHLTGQNLDQLTAASFASEMSSTGSGNGGTPEFFVARFTGFNDGGSDKVPGTDPPAAPAPSGFVLGSLGACLAWLSRRLRRFALPL